LGRLSSWLDAPCVATVKLDGTNVGMDANGLLVGRNVVIQPGATYQKVDVWKLFTGCSERVGRLQRDLEAAVGKDAISQLMLYGELLMNSKYDYSQAGIFKDWLCFGAVALPSAEDEDATKRLATSLRASGYNAASKDGNVRIVPNAKFMALLKELGVRTVSDAYQPSGSLQGPQWAEHDGTGTLPYFRSLRRLLLSEWAKRFFLPAESPPLGEGLVVASEWDGRLFKWKHGGEDLGRVPEQLGRAVEALHGLSSNVRAELLPPGLLEVFERLLLVATTPPKLAAGKAACEGKAKVKAQEDMEALAVWTSTLTKFDDLDATFVQGAQAMSILEKELIHQVASDLEKDYGVKTKDAKSRAMRVVKTEMNQRFRLWKQAQSSGA